MKHSTRKFLFSIAQPQTAVSPGLTLAQARLLQPGLGASGWRSLLNLLSKQHLISLENLGQETLLRVTGLGLDALALDLPVLSFSRAEWDGSWSCLVFKEAPRHDKQFRYLRDIVLKKRALALTRGVYLYPGSLPSALLSELQARYRTAVTLFVTNQWVLGEDRSLIIEKYALLDLAQSYSGISSEIERLINTKRGHSGLNHQDKLEIISLFDRLYATVAEDPGITTTYFPQLPPPLVLLSRLQTLL